MIDSYLSELALWKRHQGEPADLSKLVAHAVQQHRLHPSQARDLAPVELYLYTLPVDGPKADLGTTVTRLEAMEKLTLLQRVELQRRLYS